MEIELPDGTVLDAPDDADIKAVVRGYRRQQGIARLKAENPKEYDPDSNAFKIEHGPQDKQQVEVPDMDPKVYQYMLSIGMDPRKHAQKTGQTKMLNATNPNQTAAIGSGMVRGVKGLTNLVLPDSLTPEWASDETLQEMDKRDAQLPLAGKMVGNVAATLPLSMATGGVLGAASRVAPAGGALAKTLSSPWTRTALEGAQQGAIYADPDKQGEGAVGGAVLGATLRALGQGGKRALTGLVKKSEDALMLEQLAAQHGEDLFIPISQAASEETRLQSLFKTLYKEGLPIVPGVKGQLDRQSAKGADKLREIALKEALPDGGTLPPNAGHSVDAAVTKIQQQFDDAYDQTVKSYAFNVPSDLTKQLRSAVAASADPKSTVNQQTLGKVSSDVESLVIKFSDGKPYIDGANLLNVKRGISKLMGEADGHEIPAYKAADKWVDDLIETELKQGASPQNLADLKRYQDLTPAWRAFRPVKDSASQAADKEGRFLFRTLAKNADSSPEQRVIGQLGAATLDKPAASGTKAGQILASLGMAGAGIGAFMSLPATLTMLAGGNALARKNVQKALMGDLKAQKWVKSFLERNPELMRRAGSLGRAGVVTEGVREDE